MTPLKLVSPFILRKGTLGILFSWSLNLTKHFCPCRIENAMHGYRATYVLGFSGIRILLNNSTFKGFLTKKTCNLQSCTTLEATNLGRIKTCNKPSQVVKVPSQQGRNLLQISETFHSVLDEVVQILAAKMIQRPEKPSRNVLVTSLSQNFMQARLMSSGSSFLSAKVRFNFQNFSTPKSKILYSRIIISSHKVQ